jgi:iron complex outermembrane receptor protein
VPYTGARELAPDSDIDEWNEITIPAQKDPVKTTIPTVTPKWTEPDFQGINMHNPEDAIKYMPNLFIRKRFIGDRNGVLSIRGASPFQNGRTLVYVDGVLLTDLIQDRFNAPPKWQVVASEEIVSTEIIYGPYSALYSGNSMNGVVNIKTRQPNQRETTIKGSYYVQEYSDYGVESTDDGYDQFLSFGDRIGKLSLYGFIQHIENDAQPMSMASRAGAELLTALPNGAQTVPVTGLFVDSNSRNETRFVLGSTSFTHTDQDLYKLKLAYDFTDRLRAQFSIGYWETRDTNQPVKNYLIDQTTGAAVWGGHANPAGQRVYGEYGGRYFLVTSDQFTLSERDRRDMLMGLTLEGSLTDEWEFQTIFTYYDIPKDETLTSNKNPLDPNPNIRAGSGKVQEFGTTHWWSYDLKLGNDEFRGYDNLGLTAGYQYNEYVYNINL